MNYKKVKKKDGYNQEIEENKQGFLAWKANRFLRYVRFISGVSILPLTIFQISGGILSWFIFILSYTLYEWYVLYGLATSGRTRAAEKGAKKALIIGGVIFIVSIIIKLAFISNL